MEATAFRRPPGRPRKETVTLPYPPPPPARLPVFDAVVDQPISRFTLFDMQTWGPWLISRFEQKWPGRNAAYWQGMVNNVTASNDFLFIKNAEAVMLIRSYPSMMDGRARAQEEFAFSKRAEPKDEDNPDWLIVPKRSEGIHHLMSLYLYARDWNRQRGGRWMITGCCTDMPVEYLSSETLGGECADWVVVK